MQKLWVVRDFDNVKTTLERGEEKLIPSEVVYAILDGVNPVMVWRKSRGIAQQEVAEKAGISVPYLSQLETGKRRGSLDVLNATTKVLGVALDDLVVG